jgi:hypothetical protein
MKQLQARQKVIEEIPALVKDLAWRWALEQVAKSTTCGHDLFWVREVLRRIERGEVAGGVLDGSVEDAKRAAKGAADNVLSHLPTEACGAAGAAQALVAPDPGGVVRHGQQRVRRREAHPPRDLHLGLPDARRAGDLGDVPPVRPRPRRGAGHLRRQAPARGPRRGAGLQRELVRLGDVRGVGGGAAAAGAGVGVRLPGGDEDEVLERRHATKTSRGWGGR